MFDPITWLNSNSGAVTASATIVLVLVTGFYAWRTYLISSANSKQAEASQRLADEGERTRHDALRPLLVLARVQRHPSRSRMGQTEVDLRALEIPAGYTPILRINNIGVGPGITGWVHLVRLRATIDSHEHNPSPQPFMHSTRLDPLGAGESQQLRLLEFPEDDRNDYYLLITYSDVYGRHFGSRYGLAPGHEGERLTYVFKTVENLGPREKTYDP